MRKAIILVCAVAALATPAVADQAKTDTAVEAVKIDALAAVKAAEAHTPGKIASLDVDKDDETGEPYYAVEIIDNSGKEHKLAVNGLTGIVQPMSADSDRQGDNGDSDSD